MQVYQFKMWDRSFAVDIKSGNYFEVDKITSEAITLLESHCEEDVKNNLTAVSGRAIVPGWRDDGARTQKRGFYLDGSFCILMHMMKNVMNNVGVNIPKRLLRHIYLFSKRDIQYTLVDSWS